MNEESNGLDESHANPFPGLRPFHSEEDYLFFGRDEQTAELATRLRKNRFLAVVGTSGSGKSSLVRAGLIPSLLAGGMRRAGSSWEVAILRPGGRPIAQLAEALCEADLYDRELDGVLANLRVTLGRSRLGLIEAVRQSDLEEGTNLLLVVDQFEEIFRFRGAGAEAAEQAHDFVNLLLEASGREDTPIYIVITMRSDFIGDCSQFAGLAEAVNRGEYLIPRLSREQCRAAIEGPIRVAQGEITPQLVQRVLNDLGADQDRLPVLQHALMRTWDAWRTDHAEGEAIDLRHYEATGGMREALSRHADEVFDELPDERHRRIAERVFKALTERGADNREVRRPTRLGALGEVTGAGDAELRAVVDAYRRRGRTFLMPVDRALEPATVIDISHESLMRVWRRLQGWVEEEAQSARIYRRLADTAHLYAQRKAGLFRDPDLQIALAWRRESEPNQAWAARYHEGFEEAMGFLDSSEAAEQEEIAAREAVRQRELEQARVLAATQARAARNFKRFAAGVSVLAVVAVALSVWAFVLMDKARESEKSAADAATVAWNAQREAEEAGERAITARDDALHEQGRVWLERARFLLEEKRFLGAKLLAGRAIGFEGFGREALDDAFAREFPVLLRRDTEDWKSASAAIRELPEFPTIWMSPFVAQANEFTSIGIQNVAMSGDGSVLATSCSVRSGPDAFVIRVWDLASGRVMSTIRRPSYSPVDLSPDGSLLALFRSQGGKESLQLISTETGEVVRRLDLDDSGWVSDIEFGPDGSLLVLASSGGALRVVSTENGEEVARTLRGERQVIINVCWSPDGKAVAYGDYNGEVGLWDLQAPDESPVLFEGHSGQIIRDLEFSRDGRILASASSSSSSSTTRGGEVVWIWDVSTRVPKRSFLGGRGAVALHPDGARVVVFGSNGALMLYSLERDEAPEILPGPPAPRGSSDRMPAFIDFSPDGRHLVSSFARRLISVLDFESRTRLNATDAHSGTVSAVIGSDGAWLFSCDTDGKGRLWSAATGDLIREIGLPGPVYDADVAPSAGGVVLAMAAPDGAVHLTLIDAEGQQEAVRLAGHSGRVRSIDLDDSGTRLVSAGEDERVCAWELVDGAWVAEPRRFEVGEEVHAVALGGNGLLAAGGDDGAILLWDLASPAGSAPRRLDGRGGAIRSLAFDSDGTLLAAGTQDRVIRLWDPISGEEEGRLVGHSDSVLDLCFSPDGTVLASAGGQRDGTIRLWSVSAMSSLATLEGHEGEVHGVVFSPDGRTLLSAGSALRLWDVTRLELSRFGVAGESICGVALHPRGGILAVGGGTGKIDLRDSDNGQVLRSLEGHDRVIEDLVFSASGLYLASASRDETVRLWHVPTGQIVWVSEPFGNWMRSVDFSPDGQLLVAACDDRSIQLLDVATGRLVRELHGHTDYINRAVFTPDGNRIVSSSSDGTIRLWSAQSGTELRRLERGDADSGQRRDVSGLALDPTGRLLASAESGEAVYLWDLERGEVLAAFESPGATVSELRFSPDGAQLVALGPTELRLWDVASRRSLLSLGLEGAGESNSPWRARFSDDGGRIVFGDASGFVRVIDATWRPRDPSGLAERSRWFEIDGRGELHAVVPRSLYEPARIDLESPPESSYLTALRRFADGAQEEERWRELVRRFAAAGNLVRAEWLLSRLPPEGSETERAALADAFTAKAARALARSEDPGRVAALLDRAERWEPRSPGAQEVRALALSRRGEVDAALQAAEQGIDLAREIGAAARAELARLLDLRVTLELLRGEIPRAREAVDVAVGLDDLDLATRALLLERYWRAVRDAARVRYESGEPAAARAVVLAELLRWAVGETPFHGADWPLASDIERLAPAESGTRLVSRDAMWKYLDDGSDQGTAWRAIGYDDGAWDEEPGPFGFGDADRGQTRLRRNLLADDKIGDSTMTFYFRHRFAVESIDRRVTVALVELVRDDGAVIYLNGEEIHRDAMPEGSIGASTPAAAVASGVQEGRLRSARIRTSALREGTNVLAAEVHQANLGSSDLHFELGFVLQESAWTTLGLDDRAVFDAAFDAALEVLPSSLQERWEAALRFAFQSRVGEADAASEDDPERWRVRGRVRAYLGDHAGELEALERELRAREELDEVADLARRGDLRAELAMRLAKPGSSRERDAFLRSAFTAEIESRGALRINCGGETFVGAQGAVWSSDAFCAEGDVETFDGLVADAIDRRLHSHMREFASKDSAGGYHLPLANGLYRVTLYSAETTMALGERAFDVVLEGTTVLVGHDIVRAAGQEVEDRRVFGARVDDGVLDIEFRAIASGAPARVSGIEIVPLDEAEHRRLVEDQDDERWARRTLEEQGALRINCGGGDHRSASGDLWSRDRCYLGGQPSAASPRRSTDFFAQAIEGSADAPLYLSERWFSVGSPATYRIPLPPARYRVVLHFAEIWRPNAVPGRRVFDVRLEDRPVLEGYDIGARVGFASPDLHPYELEIRDGSLDLEFVRGADSPKISAIEIVPLGD